MNPAEPVIETPEDRRFRDQRNDSALFDFIKQSYPLSARCIQGAVKNVEGPTITPHARSISIRASTSTRWRHPTSY